MTGRSPSGPGSRASHEAASASSPKASIPSAATEHSCPSCGGTFVLEQVAELPDQTCLTLVFEVAEGQRIQAKTLAGVVESFDEMQKAIGAELGSQTTTLIEALETIDNEVRITFRICNAPASAIEARRAETSGSVEDESAVPERQTP